MRKNITKILIATISSVSLLSSCNFLDVDHYFEATFKEDSIFYSKRNAESYLWNVPGRFPEAGNIWGNSWCPGEFASDELTGRWPDPEFWGMQFTVGKINEENVPNWNLWYGMYRTIRRCNIMLANIDKVHDMTEPDKNEYVSYVHFMRGYAYYILFVNWGPCLIIGDEIIPTDESSEYYNKERSTFDETVDYICEEFAKSLKGLKDPANQSLNFFERPTKGAALGFISRLRLYQASPTFNGGDLARKAFGNWIRKSDGKYYVSQEYDADRWAVAAAAARQIIELEFYKLHTVEKDKKAPYPLHKDVPQENFPNGAGDIDPYRSFTDMFNGEGLAKINKEIIWGVEESPSVANYTRHCFPFKLGGWGGTSVPQRVVDCFLMWDGKTVKESTEYDSDLNNKISSPENYGSYQVLSGVPKMFTKRSARFYASIGFPGRFWAMNSASTNADFINKQFWYYANDSYAGKNVSGNNPNDCNCSGYTPVKFIHPDDSHAANKSVEGAKVTPKPFAIIRYGEILLEYVEALNNVDGAVSVKTYNPQGELIDVNVSRDVAEMKKYFNQIRYRVGLPGVTDEVVNDRAKFETVIRNERQVELFNEGYRYFDTRRWGTFIEDNSPTYWTGFDTEKEENDGFWNIKQIDTQNIRDRVSLPKMIFLPLSKHELIKVPNMDQNPGWDDGRK